MNYQNGWTFHDNATEKQLSAANDYAQNEHRRLVAKTIRQCRPDISCCDALALARLPRERVRHLRRFGLLNRCEVVSTLRKLRFLGEIPNP